MPFRKDHLQLVTDAGATLDIGWDYGTPYSLDPINGVDVDLHQAGLYRHREERERGTGHAQAGQRHAALAQAGVGCCCGL